MLPASILAAAAMRRSRHLVRSRCSWKSRVGDLDQDALLVLSALVILSFPIFSLGIR
jgi:hypothetical protein